MTISSSNQMFNVSNRMSASDKKILTENTIVYCFSLHWKAVFAEFVSTFLLVFLGCMGCLPLEGFPNKPPLYEPFGFAFAVLFNIASFGHISGAHMNPSVTLGAAIWGNISIALGIAYVIAQCAGAVAGFGILMILSPFDLRTDALCTTQPHWQQTLLQAMFVEVILTAALNFLNCSVWDQMRKGPQESTPLKFGFTIAGLSIVGGPITGASMNPARSLGPAVWTNTWNAHWIYWVGPLLGGSLSVLIYKYIWLNPREEEIDKI